MNKVLTIVGIVLAILGAGVAAFTGLPMADILGISVAMVGAAVACTGVLKKSKDDGKSKALTYTSIIMIGVGSFLMGFMGVPEGTVTQVITVVAGLASLIAGLVVSIKAKN